MTPEPPDTLSHDERTAWAVAVLAAKLPEAEDGGPQYIHPDLAEEYAAQVLREQPPLLGASRRRRVPNDHLTILTQDYTKALKFKKVREYVAVSYTHLTLPTNREV